MRLSWRKLYEFTNRGLPQQDGAVSLRRVLDSPARSLEIAAEKDTTPAARQ
jgi:hypothetical protein